MSRIGNKPIIVSEKVHISLSNSTIIVKGPKGQLTYTFNPDIKVELKGHELHVTRPSDDKAHRSLHGTTRALINNMVNGVVQGFEKRLDINGVGYRASLKGSNTLVVSAGYSHLIEKEIPSGLTVEVPTPTEIRINGMDKQLVGQFAAEVRGIRKPEPYLGKGIKYKGEVIRRKEGKKAK
jgi:large subunit ribosomal protein L6